MVIKEAKFVTSLGKTSKFFNFDKSEVAFVGRSNVGKSSLINYLTNRKGLAKVGATPGRTRLINYFDVNGDFYFVDLPGYGFAQGNKKEQQEWKKLIETYFMQSKMLKLVCVLLDIRRDVQDSDMQMISYLYSYNIPFIIIITKADKIAKTKQKGYAIKIANQIGISQDSVLISSSQNVGKQGEILDKIEQFI